MKEKAIKEIVVCTVRAPNVSVMILNWSGEVRPRVIFVLILDAFDPSTRVREQPTIFVVACLSAAFVPCKTPCLARVGLFVTLGSQRLFMYLFAKTRTPIHYLSSTSTVPRYVDTC